MKIIDKMRTKIKNILDSLPEENQRVFKSMYSYDNLTRPIPEIVDNMDLKHLKWALVQVENTIIKRWEMKQRVN